MGQPNRQVRGCGVTPLSNNTELLLAAWAFRIDGRAARPRLEQAVKLNVEGPLHEQLRTACERALKAPAKDTALVCEGIGEIIKAIGETVPPRLRQPDRRGAMRCAARRRPSLREGQLRLPYSYD
jgi:hypothetical protein